MTKAPQHDELADELERLIANHRDAPEDNKLRAYNLLEAALLHNLPAILTALRRPPADDLVEVVAQEIDRYGEGLVPGLRVVAHWLAEHFRSEDGREVLSLSPRPPAQNSGDAVADGEGVKLTRDEQLVVQRVQVVANASCLPATRGAHQQDLRNIVALVERLLRTANTGRDEVLEEAARAYALERDEDQWCQRIKYGQCALRKCNVEGGWTPGSPCDHSLATCARWRLEAALSSPPVTTVADPEIATAVEVEREACATLESVWQQALANHEGYSATGDNEHDIRFFALGLSGEAGEVANFVKKRWRDGDGHDEDLRKEVADVFAYNIMLADALGMAPQHLLDMVAFKQRVFVEKMQARARTLADDRGREPPTTDEGETR